MRCRMLICCIFLVPLFIAGAPAAADWKTVPLVQPHMFSIWNPSRAMGWDPVNQQYVIAYGGDRLYLARYTGSVWTIEIVDDTRGRGGGTSMFIQPEGTIHISYYDREQGDLWYAKNDGTGWTRELVQDDFDSGRHTSITVNDSGQAFIAYVVNPAGDDYARAADNTSGAWTDYLIDSTAKCGQYPSIALDADGKPAVAYYCYFDATHAAVNYSHFNGGLWAPSTVDSGTSVGMNPALAFGDDSQPHIAYYKSGAATYASFNGAMWLKEAAESELITTGFSNQLYFHDGIPHIFSEDFTNNRVLHFQKNPTWSYQVVATPDLFGDVAGISAAWSGGGELAVAFNTTDLDTGTMIAVTGSLTRDPAETIVDSYELAGKGRDMAVDPNGWPVTAWLAPMSDVDAVVWNGSAWSLEQAGEYQNWYYYLGVAIMPDGNPTIAYRDGGDIGRAWRTGSGWQRETIDTPVYVSQSTKIAADPDGGFHIIYMDDNNDLNYAHRAADETDWTFDPVNPGGSTWMINDLALGTGPHVNVVWNDYSTSDFYFATNSGGSFDTHTFTSAAVAGNSNATAIGPDGRPYALCTYSDDDSLHLKYRDDGATWQDKLVANGVSDNAGVGLALDDAGGIHASYFSTTDKTLYYAFAPAYDQDFVLTALDQLNTSNSFESVLALDPYGNPFIAYEQTGYGRLYLAFDLPEPQITSVAPNTGTNDGPVDAQIAGTAFFAVTEIWLELSGETIAGQNVSNPVREQAACTFDLTGATPGAYDVILSAENGIATLPGGFTVTQPADDDSSDDASDDAGDDASDDTADDDSAPISGGGDDDDDDGGCCGC